MLSPRPISDPGRLAHRGLCDNIVSMSVHDERYIASLTCVEFVLSEFDAGHGGHINSFPIEPTFTNCQSENQHTKPIDTHLEWCVVSIRYFMPNWLGLPNTAKPRVDDRHCIPSSCSRFHQRIRRSRDESLRRLPESRGPTPVHQQCGVSIPSHSAVDRHSDKVHPCTIHSSASFA